MRKIDECFIGHRPPFTISVGRVPLCVPVDALLNTTYQYIFRKVTHRWRFLPAKDESFLATCHGKQWQSKECCSGQQSQRLIAEVEMGEVAGQQPLAGALLSQVMASGLLLGFCVCLLCC